MAQLVDFDSFCSCTIFPQATTPSAAVVFTPNPLPTSSPTHPPLPLLLNWSFSSSRDLRPLICFEDTAALGVLQAGEGSGMWPPTLTLDLLLMVSLSLGAHGEQMSYRPQNCTLECIRRVRLPVYCINMYGIRISGAVFISSAKH